MYEAFFGLKSKPFNLVPDPEFLFRSKSHKRALSYLDYGLSEGAAFMLFTGEVGSGKTTIIRELARSHRGRFVFSMIFNTDVDFVQLLTMINDDFGLTTQGKEKVSLLQDLNNFLIGQFVRGNKPILIIDEAQNLTPKVLEEIRMLSNLETDKAKVLQIILVGQPELRRTLDLPSLLQFRQRISINCYINPLFRVELNEYILHRLSVAGNRTAVDFTMQALDIIYSYSRGIPRLINIICDFLMLYAFAEQKKVIDDAMAQSIVHKLDSENRFWSSEPPREGEEQNGWGVLTTRDVVATPKIERASQRGVAEDAKVVDCAAAEDSADERDVENLACPTESNMASDEDNAREIITLHDPLTPDNELALLLDQVIQRLDRMEQELVNLRAAVTMELDSKLSGLEISLARDVCESRAFVCLAEGKEQDAGNDSGAPPTVEQKNPKKSLLWRLFRLW